MIKENKNYSREKDSEENFNSDDKYSNTGESEFSRESTVPFDKDEVLSERHYNLHPLEHSIGREKLVARSLEPNSPPKNAQAKGAKDHKQPDDRIADEVKEALYRHPDVNANGINVDVSKGIVKLSGFVESIEQKKLAEVAVKDLSGIKVFYNDLSISNKPNKNPPNGLIDNITGLN